MKRRRLVRDLALVLLVALPVSARAGELLVAAAASLTDALGDLGRAYETKTATHVAFDFGATSTLERQIEAGAPADVFFSADAEHMDQLARGGLVEPSTRVDVLSNVLVVIVPAASKTAIDGPRALARLDRVALANPDSVPAGVYARTWLERAGVWDDVRPHVVPTLDVRAALAAVDGGHADAGIVYRTDAATSRSVRVALEVARADGPTIVYPVAALAHGRTGARELAGYLASPEARPVYARYGFVVLGGK